MLRPTTPSVTSSLAIDRVEDAMMDEHSVDTSSPPSLLESVVHLDELPDAFAYAYFERDAEPCVVATPSGTRVLNDRPVRPRVVHAERIVWRPVLSDSGLTGHRFDLVCGNQIEAHLEVFVSTSEIHRVAIVHRLFTPLARASGIVDRNALLEFNSPSSHLTRLKDFVSTLDSSQYYLPINELAVGRELHAAELHIDPRHERNPVSRVAATVWKHTLLELSAIAEVALGASERHNASEFNRTGLS